MLRHVSKLRIFFATIAAGGGHVATARAMAQAVEATYPGEFEVEMSDYMLELGRRHPGVRTFDARHKALWKAILARPHLARYGQRLLDAAPRLTYAAHRRLLRSFAAVVAEDMKARARGHAPALVVTNHPFLTVSFTLAQQARGFPDVPVVHFATEPLDASALWREPHAERVAVPSRAALRDLRRMGVAEDKLDLVGYPVQQPFLHAPSQAEARCHLGLSDTFTCLVSLGSEGVGRGAERTVRALLELGVQVVAVTGHNERLRARLEASTSGHINFTVRGFVDNMAQYLAACDLMVGKAGPASVMEALAVGRPVLVTRYAGLNERKLVHFLSERRLGAYAPDIKRLTQEVSSYRSAPERLCEVRRRSAALGLAEMTEQLARYLARAATHGLPEARFEGRGLE